MPGRQPAVDLTHYGLCTLDQDGCLTCGDVAVPVRVLAVAEHEAVCEDRLGQRATVAVDFIPGVAAGDVLLVHLRVAIARVGDDQSSVRKDQE
jgi:hydrogenase expression/formation protein HypC